METESKEGDNKVLSSAGNAHVQVEPTTPLQVIIFISQLNLIIILYNKLDTTIFF